MHSHFDLKKSHFDSRNRVPDVMSSPVLRKVGKIMLWNGLERMAVVNRKLDQMLLKCTGAWAGHQ
jgi:hypothetical protein